MALNLNHFYPLRIWLLGIRVRWLRLVVGVDARPDLLSSLSSRFRAGRRGSIVIGSQTLVAFKTLIYSRDMVTGEVRPVKIGSRCFIGGGSTVLPGVTIGDQCLIGAGSVVFDDVPSRSIAAGNPARVIRRGVEIGPFGRLPDYWPGDQAPL